MTELRDRLLVYLKEQMKFGSPRYFKAKWIGEELGLSAKQVGTNLAMLAKETKELVITAHSNCVGCTTWKVEIV